MSRYHDRDAEIALIGAALLEPSILDQVALAPEAFFAPQHKLTWRTLLELQSADQPLDPILVAERANNPHIKPADLVDALLKCSTATNAEYYANIVRKHATTRAVLQATAQIQELHRRGEAEGVELLDQALAAINAIDVGKSSEALTIGQVVKKRFAKLDRMLEAKQRGELAITGVPTGLPSLDRILAGIQPGIPTILAGRPGMGKSALALQIADAASAHGHGVHVFSLEDSQEAYADRSLSTGARVPVIRIRTAQLRRQDMTNMTRRASELWSRKKWLYHDVRSMTAEDVVRAVRRMRKDNDTKLVIVDYIQRLQKPTRYQSENYAMEHMINVLATAAKADNLAYLVLSQLSRDCEKRDDKRPRPSDLRDSGALENVGKCVLALYRGSVYGPPREGMDYEKGESGPTDEEWEKRMEILILKQNHGDTGVVICKWDGPCTRVYE